MQAEYARLTPSVTIHVYSSPAMHMDKQQVQTLISRVCMYTVVSCLLYRYSVYLCFRQ